MSQLEAFSKSYLIQQEEAQNYRQEKLPSLPLLSNCFQLMP